MKFRTTMKSIEYNGIERPEYTPDMISELKADEVFVFGSVCKDWDYVKPYKPTILYVVDF